MGPIRLHCGIGSTRTIMVIVTFGTQRSRPSVWSPVTISCGISSSSVLSLVWLLILVVPGGVIRLSFVVSPEVSAQVLFLLSHEFSGELRWHPCIVLCLVASHCPQKKIDRVPGNAMTYFFTCSISSKISDRTFKCQFLDIVLAIGSQGRCISRDNLPQASSHGSPFLKVWLIHRHSGCISAASASSSSKTFRLILPEIWALGTDVVL
ncbi:hypothetical protein Tco_1474639 [Tanacetum coccineum]